MYSHMAETADRSSAVLVVVDIQERLAAVMPERDRVLRAASLLIRAAAIVDVPIVVTRQYPKGLGETESPVLSVLEEVRQTGARIETVDKMSFDCFAETPFAELMRSLGRQQPILAGMETHICVTQTALAALHDGYQVQVAADACCSRDVRNHDLAVMRCAHAGAVVTTSESVAYELIGCAGTDDFKKLLSAVKAQDM